jgi:hypothetical protein
MTSDRGDRGQQAPADEIVLDGSLVNRDENTISLELYPGAVIDLKLSDVRTLEEGTEPLSGRSFVRVALNPDAELKGTFRPRLLKLALSRDPSRIPFALGGTENPTLDVGAIFPTYTAQMAGTGSGPGGGGLGGQPTITEKRSKSMDPIWGLVNDDVILSDRTQGLSPA